MSLRVWLPLDGDLCNYGLSTVTVSSGTATYGAGKIGAKGLDLINSAQINLFCDKLANVTTFSICCWIKGSKDTSDSDWVSPIRFGAKKSDTTENYDFRFGKHDNASGTEGYPVGVYHNSNNTISNTNNTFTTAEDWEKWVHICFIYDGTNIKGYKNGIQVFSHSGGQGGYLTGNFRLRVGRCNWLINDLRIYDHCLSAAEVKEIAQGLVLHYKLDEGNENLLLDAPKSHSPTAYNAYQFDMKENLVAGQTYTIQLWDVTVEHSAKTAAQMNLQVYWGGGNVRLHNFNGSANFTILRDHYAYSPYLCAQITPTEANASGSGATNKWLNIYNSVSNADGTRNMEIGAWKLEKGAAATQWVSSDADMTKIQDSSGYNHNGTASDNLTISSNMPRYSSSTRFNGSDTYIACGRGGMVRDAITVNIWAYMDTWVNTPGRIVSCTQSGGWNFEDSSGRIVFQCGTGDTANTYAGVVSPTTITYGGLASGWHMFTGTYDGLSSKLYIDGEFINANNKYTTHTPLFYHSSNGIFLGAEAAGSQTTPTTPYFNGLLSDFRIYCTPLLDTDVKQLYNVSMKIDKSSKIHTFAVFENGQNKITKQGQLKCANIIEFNGLSYLKYDSNLYIEPDGSCWVRIFHHNNPANGVFSVNYDYAHSCYVDVDRWFNMELCNYVSTWELMVKQKYTNDQEEKKWRWIQNVNPMTATFNDTKAASITRITTTGYSPSYLGGYYYLNTSTTACLAGNNGTNGNWWGGLGTNKIYQGGTPGYIETSSDTSSANAAAHIVTTGYIDCYIRIDNLSTTFPSNAKSTKNNLWLTSNIIER